MIVNDFYGRILILLPGGITCQELKKNLQGVWHGKGSWNGRPVLSRRRSQGPRPMVCRTPGVSEVPQSYDEECWQQAAGPTVFAPFDRNADYFGRPEQQWMISFRVRDLDAMVASCDPPALKSRSMPRRSPMAALPVCTILRATRWNCGSRRKAIRRAGIRCYMSPRGAAGRQAAAQDQIVIHDLFTLPR